MGIRPFHKDAIKLIRKEIKRIQNNGQNKKDKNVQLAEKEKTGQPR